MESLTHSIAILSYFDPGAGSIVVQALVGGAAGLLVFGHYLWCRVVDRFRRRSGLESNSP